MTLSKHHLQIGSTRQNMILMGAIREQRIPYPGLDKVLEEAKKLVQKYRGDQRIRDLALSISSNIGKHPLTGKPDMRNFKAVGNALYNWIVRHVMYVRDPHGIERLQSPDITINYGAGDCDDMSILGASLLESVGIPSRFVIASFEPGQPSRFSHIYVEFNHRGQWISFDPTLATGIGKLPPSPVTGRKTIALDDIFVPRKARTTPISETPYHVSGSRFFTPKKKVASMNNSGFLNDIQDSESPYYEEDLGIPPLVVAAGGKLLKGLFKKKKKSSPAPAPVIIQQAPGIDYTMIGLGALGLGVLGFATYKFSKK